MIYGTLIERTMPVNEPKQDPTFESTCKWLALRVAHFLSQAKNFLLHQNEVRNDACNSSHSIRIFAFSLAIAADYALTSQLLRPRTHNT